jgi:hypothetical protein
MMRVAERPRRLARRGSPDHGPHMGRTVPRFHRPAESQSALTFRRCCPHSSRGKGFGAAELPNQRFANDWPQLIVNIRWLV